MIKGQPSELTYSFSHVKWNIYVQKNVIGYQMGMSLCLYEGTKAYQQIIMLQFGMETKERYKASA